MMYRLRQLQRALTGRISARDLEFVAEYLSPKELRLFQQMAGFDQRHCLDVAQTLVRGGYRDHALLGAALLHDVGKVGDDGRPIPLIYYGAFVVLKRLAPGLYRRAVVSGRGPLWPFALHASHEQRSAKLAQTAGSAPEVVTILRAYAAQQETAETRLLQWADDLN